MSRWSVLLHLSGLLFIVDLAHCILQNKLLHFCDCLQVLSLRVSSAYKLNIDDFCPWPGPTVNLPLSALHQAKLVDYRRLLHLFQSFHKNENFFYSILKTRQISCTYTENCVIWTSKRYNFFNILIFPKVFIFSFLWSVKSARGRTFPSAAPFHLSRSAHREADMLPSVIVHVTQHASRSH